MKKILSLVLAILTAFTALGVQPARAVVNIIYVNDDASGAGTGADWANAYKKLQNALGAATFGDQIWVAAGVYYPDEGSTPVNNNRGESFDLINGAAIYGGFNGTETLLTQRNPTANVTILSGDIDQDDTNTDGNNIAEDVTHIQGSNAYNVVSATFPNVDTSAVLDGFVITAGKADGSPLQNTTVGGGVRLISGNSPTLANLTIIGNSALANGGGMFANDNSNPSLTSVLFTANHADNGGGIYADDSNPTLSAVTFNGNSADYGGGMSAVSTSMATLSNVLFQNNSATGGGGGMVISNSTPSLTDVTLSLNSAAIGGGLYISTLSHPGLTNVTISQNSAAYGAGIYLLGNTGTDFAYMTAYNITVSDNDASLLGGGMYGYYGNATFTNATFSDNSAGTSGGGIYNTETSATYFTNIIIANSVGGDCVNVNGSDSLRFNTLFEDAANACGATNGINNNIVGSDPMLGPLQDNGGLTETHALLAGSPAIDTGDNDACAAYPINNDSQNGVPRPQDGDNSGTATCDIGSYEVPSLSPPTVTSITRADANPTSSLSVDFTVIFSEPVSIVDAADYVLFQSGVSGATVSGVSGSGNTYTVTVNTGTGSGIIRLDVPDTAVITDASGNPLDNLPFTSGETYTVIKSLPFKSNGSQDGWILESSETSGVGGTMNSAAAFAYLGDNAAMKQYRMILSFDTSLLPDNATITKVTLKLKKLSLVGGNPFVIFNGMMVDIKKGAFGIPALALADFNATASRSVGPQSPALVAGWYSLNLTPAKAYVNKLGTNFGLTQIRVRFRLDDNNNAVANILKLYSGNAGAANRPQLIVEYYVP